MTIKKCVYTTIINDYDYLHEPSYYNKDWNYYCFTNNSSLKSKTWTIVYVEFNSVYRLDAIKESRFYKTNYHVYLNEYNVLLYVDARIKISSDLNDLYNTLLDNDILFFKHPIRNNIIDECLELKKLKLESPSVIDEVLNRYKLLNYNDNTLLMGGLILFKNNNAVLEFFNNWWQEIKLYSHRDQISLPFALSLVDQIKVKAIQSLLNNKSFCHMPRKSKRINYEL